MQRTKDLISFVVLMMLLAICLASVVRVARQDLPADKTKPVDLGYWLTERNLQTESRETRSMLVGRLDEELHTERDWAQEFKKLDDNQRRQLEQNFERLLEQWFLDKANEYFRRPESERAGYLDRELDTVFGLIERWLPKQARSASPFPATMAGMALLSSRIQAWIDQADPAQRSRLREFQMALQDRLVYQELERELRDK